MNIAHARLRNQWIAHTSARAPAEVVRRLGAVQAQDYAGALWGIGLRAGRMTEAGVEQAIAARFIVRTWPMRGTLHFVPATDARWLLELLTPRVLRASAGRHRQLELNDATFTRARKIFETALEGGRILPRTALYRLLQEAGIDTAAARGLHILSYLAQERVICFGPRAGKQQTFALFDDWLPEARSLPREEALGRLTIRYFTSHGPASAHDFAWWAGLPLGDVKHGLGLAAAALQRDVHDGTTYWFVDAVAGADAAPVDAYLLPPYDEFTVAYRDRSAVLDAKHARRVAAGGILNPTIVHDGRVVGTWRRTLKKDAVAIALAPFGRLSAAQKRAVAVAADRYGAFLGVSAAVMR